MVIRRTSPKDAIRKALAKVSKKGAGYHEDGKPNHHCGPSAKWRTGYCKFFLVPNACERVVGEIHPNAGCDLYQPAKERK